MSKQITGSCLCGGFKYMVENTSKVLLNCHCGMCRTYMGAAFLPCFLVPKDDIVLLETSTIATYKSSKNVKRYFCNICGCSTHAESLSVFAVCSGTVDGDIAIKEIGEAYTKYKVPWHQLYAGVPSSEEDEIFAKLF